MSVTTPLRTTLPLATQPAVRLTDARAAYQSGDVRSAMFLLRRCSDGPLFGGSTDDVSVADAELICTNAIVESMLEGSPDSTTVSQALQHLRLAGRRIPIAHDLSQVAKLHELSATAQALTGHYTQAIEVGNKGLALFALRGGTLADGGDTFDRLQAIVAEARGVRDSMAAPVSRGSTRSSFGSSYGSIDASSNGSRVTPPAPSSLRPTTRRATLTARPTVGSQAAAARTRTARDGAPTTQQAKPSAIDGLAHSTGDTSKAGMAATRVAIREAIKDPVAFAAKIGIGGLESQIKTIVESLMSRGLEPDQQAIMGLQHARGLIFYGPPGTGKTKVACRIAELIGAKKTTILRGPEILNSYVGRTEESLRGLFDEVKDGLHVIVFDEIDSLFRSRRSDSGPQVYNNAVSQLLTLLDGPAGAANVLVIGTTNRLGDLDAAILRPPRIEAEILFPLPDSTGREAIFRIYTKSLAEQGALADDVELDILARGTEGLSGAHIENIVNAARKAAAKRVLLSTSGHESAEVFQVTQQDLVEAVKSTTRGEPRR